MTNTIHPSRTLSWAAQFVVMNLKRCGEDLCELGDPELDALIGSVWASWPADRGESPWIIATVVAAYSVADYVQRYRRHDKRDDLVGLIRCLEKEYKQDGYIWMAANDSTLGCPTYWPLYPAGPQQNSYRDMDHQIVHPFLQPDWIPWLRELQVEEEAEEIWITLRERTASPTIRSGGG